MGFPNTHPSAYSSYNIALGADLSWVTQLEAIGCKWVDKEGRQIDPFLACKEMGVNAVRLRIFVDPPASALWEKRPGEICLLGYCDLAGVIIAAKRARALSMKLMLSFHYSDHFADPEFQNIPQRWMKSAVTSLAKEVFLHTAKTLAALSYHGLVPDWVSVGNEINFGLLWPTGRLDRSPDDMCAILNAGYEAVKTTFPTCPVITHLAAAQLRDWCDPFLSSFFSHGGLTDILGFSYYPYWQPVSRSREKLISNLRYYADTYKKPVMIVETGGEDNDPTAGRGVLFDCLDAVKSLPHIAGFGVFYWAPEVNRAILPDRYPLGASQLVDDHTLRFSEVLSVYRDFE